MTSALQRSESLEDPFVKVWFQEDSISSRPAARESQDSAFREEWIRHGSGDFNSPTLYGAKKLRELYPKHSLVMTQNFNPLRFPGAYTVPINGDDIIANVVFTPLARRFGDSRGALREVLEYGAYKVAWSNYEFVAYFVMWPVNGFKMMEIFLLHDGPEQPLRDFVTAAGVYESQLHEEIWVFNQGYWSKNRSLWVEIQKANWKDVILEKNKKAIIQKDLFSFFKSKDIYKNLGIPWKRGIIMYGPPGNGKTISLKAVMKSSEEEGFLPLYVKSFQSFSGEEASMQRVFDHARSNSPCLLVLEDIDSLITDRNRSFFLNQLDGLEDNDGILLIGTTNHIDRLDPGLSSRPSRFDRKYLFDNPDRDERILYARWWKEKLKYNDSISFPDVLAEEVADATEDFSFAYLKEAFVSSLVLIAGDDGPDKPEFSTILKKSIQSLRDELEKSAEMTDASLTDLNLNLHSRSVPEDRLRLTNELAGHADIMRVSEVLSGQDALSSNSSDLRVRLSDHELDVNKRFYTFNWHR